MVPQEMVPHHHATENDRETGYQPVPVQNILMIPSLTSKIPAIHAIGRTGVKDFAPSPLPSNLGIS